MLGSLLRSLLSRLTGAQGRTQVENNTTVETFLLDESERLQDYKHRSSADNDKSAVLIETRNHPLLVPVIRNVMSALNDGWDLTIFGSSENERVLKQELSGWDYKFIDLSSEQLDANAYNRMLRESSFWDAISGEKILTFQTDSAVVNSELLGEFDNDRYDFIGGTYHVAMPGFLLDVVSPEGDFNICGGFTLRSKKFIEEAIHNISDEDILRFRKAKGLNNSLFENWRAANQPMGEDVFFHHSLVMLGRKTPSLQECNRFCFDMTPEDVQDAFAMHGFIKCVIAKERYDTLLRKIIARKKQGSGQAIGNLQ